MTRDELNKLIEEQINAKAKTIINEDAFHDDAAVGALKILLPLRRVLTKRQTLEDIGMLHAVNYVLQELGVISKDETLLSMIEK
ncbi:hypothetical protein BK666_20065 [Pseudomonas frederiksbergensis]|uniref:Uncharacterized protein n=1 Tax=Pseudomonas frederiksbergensis TaxID=104087 RepID=A0A423JZF8_9PSED|nr:hypothetical protein [Pseudomonas frederiksbergensis]RON43383.1 hypothetical protein BK666_20065 [Pseudomonas frederiksbergensis]